MLDEELTSGSAQLASRVRLERMLRGWDVCELERRSGVARTTLYHLEKGHTQRVRSSTVAALARAFEIPVERLLAPQFARSGPSDAGASGELLASAGPRATGFRHPAIQEVFRERPEVFAGWSSENWDELQAQFGPESNLSPLGALKAAEAINDQRETIRQLQVVLETDLRDVAREVIQTFYRMVRAGASRSSGGEQSEPVSNEATLAEALVHNLRQDRSPSTSSPVSDGLMS